MKIYMVSLFHRATIKKKKEEEERRNRMKIQWSALSHRATITSGPQEIENLRTDSFLISVKVYNYFITA